MSFPLDDTEDVTQGHNPRPAEESTQQLIGMLAFSALAAMTRLAKDGDQAPNTAFHVDHARMAARGFREFQHLEKFAVKGNFDLIETIDQFSGLFDELDVRTRPSTWWERSVKTYVVLGIFADSLMELCQRHQVFEDYSWTADLGQGVWVREQLGPLTSSDPQLAARLSLWSRRVAGETFGLLRATLFSYPELAMDPDTVDAVVALATKRHLERLEAINLKA